MSNLSPVSQLLEPRVIAARASARVFVPHTIALLPHQTPPPAPWRSWLLLGGRGAGKTLAGACWLLDQAHPHARLAIIAPTFADARDVCVEGPSGVLEVARRRGLTIEAWNRSLGEARIGSATLKLFSADQPERLRGPQHSAIWGDECGAWRYGEMALDMALMGLRQGSDPRIVLTTTPRPTALMRRLMAESTVTRATTFANVHLPAAFREQIVARYDGTRLGLQELEAQLLEDTPGALWTRAQLDACRVSSPPILTRIVVAIDPSATETGDEAGIVVCGIGPCACLGREADHGFVLSDDSVQAHPAEWARSAVAAYRAYRADALIAEDNNGGQMVEVTIGTIPGAPPVRRIHASRGKQARAEPIAMLYEQRKVHMVGSFAALEDELTTWVPGMESPNRLDAMVWALTELMLTGGGGFSMSYDRRNGARR